MELSVNIFVSLDGVMQGPGAPEEDPSNGFERGGWLIPFAEGMDVVDTWFERADAILLGRTTYELMKSFWPQITDEDTTGVALNTLPKYVVSTTLSDADADWDKTTVIRGEDIVGQIKALKQQEGRELQVHGSWQLARTLHDAGLVDTYRLLQFPVVVGDGKRLFDTGAAPESFALQHSQTTSTGATALTLRPTGFRTGGIAVVDGKELLTA